MTNTKIGRWARAVAVAGLVVTTSAVAQDQPGPDPTAITLADATVPFTNIASLTQNTEKDWELTTTGGVVIKSKGPPKQVSLSFGGFPIPFSQFKSLTQLTDGKTNTWQLVTKDGQITSPNPPKIILSTAHQETLRPAPSSVPPPEAKSQPKAGEGITAEQAREIIRQELGRRKAGERESEDDDSRSRCECAYCHPLHRAGTCSLRCAPMTLPTFPTVGSSAPMPYYSAPYAPRHHFLHGLFCPCSWCRGGW
jgi:hypothetical protein